MPWAESSKEEGVVPIAFEHDTCLDERQKVFLSGFEHLIFQPSYGDMPVDS